MKKGLLLLLGAALPAALSATGPGAVADDSTLAVGDTIRIEVYLEPDLTTVARIDPAGQVRLPLVDNLRLAGLTVAGAQTAVEEAYRTGEFLLRPHAIVRVESRVTREVMISGQVRAPGSYAMPPDTAMSVLELIAKAGGFTDLARANAVSVTRTGEDGGKTTSLVEAARLIRGEGDAKAVGLLLRPGDIVFVPERIF